MLLLGITKVAKITVVTPDSLSKLFLLFFQATKFQKKNELDIVELSQRGLSGSICNRNHLLVNEVLSFESLFWLMDDEFCHVLVEICEHVRGRWSRVVCLCVSMGLSV